MNNLNKLILSLEEITPAVATDMLNANTLNRRLRPGVVEKYASDMRANTWTRCIAPVCFYEDGNIADGQHRLFAIIESNTTQFFFVIRGLDRTDGMNIDVGLNRSIVDNARISGLDPNLSNTLIGVARGVEMGDCMGGGKSLSNSGKMELVHKHREASTWAMHNGPRSKFLRNGLVLSAIARAWYVETDHAKLKRYCDVLQSGFADGTVESAAIAMRNYLLAKGSASSTNALWRDTFLRVQNSISYFMRGRALTIIREITDEVYPLHKPRGRKK